MQYESRAIPEYLRVHSIVAVLKTRFLASEPPIVRNRGERHDFPELIYIKGGTHSMLLGDEVYDINDGQIMIYAPNLDHSGYGGTDCDTSILSFKADFGILPEIYNKVITLAPEQKRLLEVIIDEGVAAYEKRAPGSDVRGMVVREGVSEFALQKIKRDLELFLLDIYRTEGLLADSAPRGKTGARRAQFLAVVKYLKEHIGEELTVEDIARASSMSVSKLKMLCREHKSGGPINLFIDLKIDYAKELIAEGEMNLTEISGALGFNSLHYFSRLFKARTGITPSKWSRNVK